MLENASECQFNAKKHIWGNEDLEVALIEKIEMIMIWHVWSKENEALLENDWNEYKWWFIWSTEEEVSIWGRFCLNQFSCFLLSCCTELPPSSADLSHQAFHIFIVIIIIIITRPKPAYGRQGLAGSWGQDTDEVSTFLVFLMSHFAPAALSSD